MYRRASRAMQHAHRVDRIDPSKGFVWRDTDVELIQNASNMSLGMCRDELRQLSVELAKLETSLAIAKREKDKKQVEFLGGQKASLCQRRSTIKERKRELLADKDYELLRDAVNAVCNESIKQKVFAHARHAREAFEDASQ